MKRILLIIMIAAGGLVFAGDNETSTAEERRRTLLYGIDSEISSLLTTLSEEKDDDYNQEIYAYLKSTENPRMKEEVLQFFRERKEDLAVADALAMLTDPDLDDEKIQLVALNYVTLFDEGRRGELFLEYVDDNSPALSKAAVQALGESGDREAGKRLFELYEEDDIPEVSRSEALKSLGRLQVEEALPLLIELVGDSGEERGRRWAACQALGYYQNEEAYEGLRQALFSDDNYLRSYAVEALGRSEQRESSKLLIQALRDSFWRVRKSAAAALGMKKAEEALDILMYKAERDPEEPVRREAISALAAIEGRKAEEFLQHFYQDEEKPPHERIFALDGLIEMGLDGSLKVIKEVFEAEWSEEDSYLLEKSCHALSFVELPRLEEFFAMMLQHNEAVIRMHGLRGIDRNSLSSLRENVEKLIENEVNASVKRRAEGLLEEL